jgi:F0F1-type ATP synthase epsilon subunit
MSEDEANAKKDQDKSSVAIPEGQMLVKVYAPYRVYFEGPALSLSGENDSGPFDILVGHHKFLTLVHACELEIRTNEGSEKIKIDKAIMFVLEDRVTVFLDV